MAKKRDTGQAPSKENWRVCRDCSHAYGYCYPARDGRPLSCRCDIGTQYLVPCWRKACEQWEQRTEPVPESVPLGYVSEDRDASSREVKTVPVFGYNGELLKTVNADSISGWFEARPIIDKLSKKKQS